MALVVGDRVQETTTTTGTGTVSLLGAVTQFQSFAAGIGNGNSTYYTIADQSGVNWEEGIGTYTTSGSTLTRSVLASSNANALVNFPAGTKNVFCSYPAEAAVLAAPYAYPTVSPTLNLNFVNSNQVDPRITFVRSTTATYYDGKTTALAEQNLLLYSNTFSNAAWVATNGTVASGMTDPAGTTTAFSFTATSATATLYQTLTTTATPYTLSFYIQRVTGTGAVNLTLDGTTLTAQTITGSWARYSVTATPTAASHTIGLQLAVSGDVVNIFSSQLENRSSVTAANITTTAAITNYIPQLMTAPAGVPRLDYNPTTGQALGLLIEEARTNLLTYSNTFSNAIWTLTNATLTAAATVAPDGTQTAFNLVSNTSTGLQAIAQTVTKAASALAYTSTVYFKANQYTYSWLQISDGAGNGAIVYFNLTTGAISTAVAGIGTAFTALSATTPTAVGNGWYRCNITGTSNTATSLVTQFGSSTNGTSNSVVGNGYSGVFIWGAQLEQGSFATSYIPTLASQVTRNADQASMTGTNFSSWYNQSQGSLYCNVSVEAGNAFQALPMVIYNNTTNIGFYNSSTSNIGAEFRNNGTTYSSSLFFQTYPATLNLALTYSSGSFNFCRNGVNNNYSIPTTMPSNINYLAIGGAFTGFWQAGGIAHIRTITYYPQALSSANLQALTS